MQLALVALMQPREPNLKFHIFRDYALLQIFKNLSITDQGKDTGILLLSLTGDDPELTKIYLTA